MAWWPAACTHHHTARGLTTPPQYHPSNRAAVANGTKTASAQPKRLEFPARPLMRLHPQEPHRKGPPAGCHTRADTVRRVVASGAAQTDS